jgi:hypothetical protein
VSTTGGFNVAATSVYTQANCTRQIISGMDPFITVRYAVNAGQSLRCYFPGFVNPTEGYGSSISVSFHVSNTHHYKNQNLPYDHYSAFQTTFRTTSLTTQNTIQSI